MENERSYWLVRRCCYLGMFIQAMVINLTPLFFIPLKEEYHLTFEQLGRLVLINFLTQMVVDLVCTAVVDRFGMVKVLTVAAQILSAVGLWLFAGAPFLFPETPYYGLVLGTVIFSLGCGLLEVLISPIINALPSHKKAGDMAFLHAFYPIGKVVVIAVSALLLSVLGNHAWGWIALCWSIVPLVNAAGFLAVKMPPFVHESEREKTAVMAKKRMFWLAMIAILLAGATEVTFAQWTSAFAQSGLGMSQMVADWLGFGLFAGMMVVGRLWFGIYGHHLKIKPILLSGAVLSTGSYLVVAFCPWPVVSLIACIMAGFFVSLLWPGIVSLSAASFPRAGISLFALLAAFGDTGAGVMPWIVGVSADSVERIVRAGNTFWPGLLHGADDPAQVALRAGMLGAALCPLILIVILSLMRESKTTVSKTVE